MTVPLDILLTTYAPGQLRIDAVIQTVKSWQDHLKVNRDIHIHVADDGSSLQLNYDEVFWHELIGDWATLTYSRQERGGLGASINKGLDICQSPFILYPMDDWSLSCDLSLEPWIQLLVENEDIGCIRMGQPSGNVRGGRGRRFGLLVGVLFERSGFYWSLVPMLYHRRFFQTYGKFTEGVSPLETEQQYNTKVIQGGPDVLVAMLTPWQHLWSIKTGDVEPIASFPAERLKGTVNVTGYDFL